MLDRLAEFVGPCTAAVGGTVLQQRDDRSPTATDEVLGRRAAVLPERGHAREQFVPGREPGHVVDAVHAVRVAVDQRPDPTWIAADAFEGLLLEGLAREQQASRFVVVRADQLVMRPCSASSSRPCAFVNGSRDRRLNSQDADDPAAATQ